MMRRTSLAVVGVCLSIGVAIVPSGQAVASCAGEFTDVAADADSLFIGTVLETRDGFARFQVDEVWRGPDLASKLWVQTGQKQPPWPISLFEGGASSTDADLAVGRRYVVGTYGDFVTNSCLVAEMGNAADFGDLKPATVREPVATAPQGADPPVDGRLLMGGALAVLVGGVAWLVWFRKQRAPSPTRLAKAPVA